MMFKNIEIILTVSKTFLAAPELLFTYYTQFHYD